MKFSVCSEHIHLNQKGLWRWTCWGRDVIVCLQTMNCCWPELWKYGSFPQQMFSRPSRLINYVLWMTFRNIWHPEYTWFASQELSVIMTDFCLFQFNLITSFASVLRPGGYQWLAGVGGVLPACLFPWGLWIPLQVSSWSLPWHTAAGSLLTSDTAVFRWSAPHSAAHPDIIGQFLLCQAHEIEAPLEKCSWSLHAYGGRNSVKNV